MKEEFNQKEYKKKFNKDNYKQFKVHLKINEKEELDKLLEEKNLTKADFIRQAKILLEKGYFDEDKKRN